MLHYDVIVIGGGAAGLMCAITAGQRGRRVLVLDSANKVGKKILMSGGGRCNFTNRYVEPDNFLSANPHFCKSALSRYTQWDFIALVQQHGIAYHERKHGQLFCDVSAKNILTMLLNECNQAGVTIRTNCSTQNIEPAQRENARFAVTTSVGDYTAGSLVVATGGLSIPKMGASAFGYAIARQFNLDVLPTRAGLVPFVFSDSIKDVCARLSGVSLDCELSVRAHSESNSRPEISFIEALLFTHRGISGPAVLQLSNYWSAGEEIFLDLLPAFDIGHWLKTSKAEHPKILLRTLLAEKLPKNLVLELERLFWAEEREKSLADWSDSALAAVALQLTNWTLKPSGTEGYRTAEVTLGGVDTNEISSKTMESKRQPGLFFIGEVVDVTGHLGGFNFQWAWASGYAAGCHA